MYIIESEKPDNFYLGKNNSAAEKAWKFADSTAKGIQQTKKGGNYITWSSQVDWNGFEQDISYAKTLDDKIIHVSQARYQNLVQINFKGKHSYMTKDQFEKHKIVIQPFLQKKRDHFGFNDYVYWNS